MSALRIGLMGLGTVGQGVLRTLRNNREEIARRVGRDLVVTHIATKDLDRNSEPLDGITVSDDALSCVKTMARSSLCSSSRCSR